LSAAAAVVVVAKGGYLGFRNTNKILQGRRRGKEKTVQKGKG
jgi:hypothetical protein